MNARASASSAINEANIVFSLAGFGDRREVSNAGGPFGQAFGSLVEPCSFRSRRGSGDRAKALPVVDSKRLRIRTPSGA